MTLKLVEDGWSETLPKGFYSLIKTIPHKFGSVQCVIAVVAGDIQAPKLAARGNGTSFLFFLGFFLTAVRLLHDSQTQGPVAFHTALFCSGPRLFKV
jgi:hypothetical protein